MPRFLFITAVILMQTSIIGNVDRVIDGDTILVRIGDRVETVRYIGVDTPETVHPTRGIEPYGLAASAFNRILVEGRQVRIELDMEPRDRYGRLLAYIYTDSLFVNAELIRQGYAQVMTVPPNVRHVEEFVLLQRKARAAEAGLWGIETDIQAATLLAENASNTDVSTIIDRFDNDEHAIVYITSTGTKYHQAGCHHLRQSSIPITLAEAGKRGYSACQCLHGRGAG